MTMGKKSAKCNLADGNIQLINLILLTKAVAYRCNFQKRLPEEILIMHNRKDVMEFFFYQRLLLPRPIQFFQNNSFHREHVSATVSIIKLCYQFTLRFYKIRIE